MSYERIIRLPTVAALAQTCASRLSATISELQKSKPMVNLCLTGGHTANLVYESFAAQATNFNFDPGRIQLWFGDERLVPLSDPNRNSQQTLAILARTIPINSANTHLMPGIDGNADPSDAAFAYAQELGDTQFDICLLNIGKDGHIAAIFPNHPSMDSVNSTVIGVTDAPCPPAERISLSLSALSRSSQVWFLAAGSQKANVVKRALEHDPMIPASYTRGCDNTFWFLDEAACAELPPIFACDL